MIKLINLLNELEKPEQIYAPGQGPEAKDDGIIQKGFRTTNTVIDPETGASVSTVEYLPKFEQIKKDLQKYRKEFQPFKYHSNESIAVNAKNINTLLTKASNLIFALDKMIELERKSK